VTQRHALAVYAAGGAGGYGRVQAQPLGRDVRQQRDARAGVGNGQQRNAVDQHRQHQVTVTRVPQRDGGAVRGASGGGQQRQPAGAQVQVHVIGAQQRRTQQPGQRRIGCGHAWQGSDGDAAAGQGDAAQG